MPELQEFFRLLSDPRVLSNPAAAGQILIALATLAIIACGFALMCSTIYAPLRRFCARFFVLGIFLVLASAVVPGLLSVSAGSLPMLPDWAAVWLGVVGVSAFILGMKGAGLLLAVPAIILYILAPMLGPEWETMPAAVRQVILPILLTFGGILVLQWIIQAIYGKEAAGTVAGTYLVRALDAFGRGFSIMFGWPFRFWRRTRGE